MYVIYFVKAYIYVIILTKSYPLYFIVCKTLVNFLSNPVQK